MTFVILLCSSRITRAENLIENPDFAHGLDGFASHGNAEIDEGVLFEGKPTLKHFGIGGDVWNTVQERESIAVTPGKIYRLSVFSESTLEGGGADIGLRQIDANGKTLAYSWMPVSQKTWGKDSFCLRPTVGTVRVAVYLKLDSSVTAGNVWWSKLNLEAFNDPFSKTPSNRFVQIAPLPEIVFEAGSPDQQLPRLWIEAGRDAMGGHFKWRLRKQGELGTSESWNSQLIAIEGPSDLSFDPFNLAPGPYWLDVQVEDVSSAESLSSAIPIYVINSHQAVQLPGITKSQISQSGRLLVNGKPFSSIMFYHFNATPEMTREKLRHDYFATTCQGGGWGGGLEAIENDVALNWSAGLYTWVTLFGPDLLDRKNRTWDDKKLEKLVNRLKSHPGVVGWNLIDEPDGLKIPATEVRRVADLIRKWDPNHVIWVNLSLLDKFEEYSGISDFASYDLYPFPVKGLGPIREYNNAIAATAPHHPLLCVLQAFGPPLGGFPPPALLRAEVYTCICDGMTQFHYYAWDDPAPSITLRNMPEIKSYTRRLNYEVDKLQDFLASEEQIPLTMEQWSGKTPPALLAKRIGRDIVAIVVNQEGEPIEHFRLTIKDKGISSSTAYFEGESPGTVQTRGVEDSLPPYGVAVYRLQEVETGETVQPNLPGPAKRDSASPQGMLRPTEVGAIDGKTN